MLFLFMSLVALLPFFIGITILFILKQTQLAKAIFFYLLLASIWQMDVALLYAHNIFSLETIDLLFRLFRFGSIMLSPALFYIAFVIIRKMNPKLHETKWRYVMNNYVVAGFFIWSFIVYLIGWSSKGIQELQIISDYESSFLFPLYGSLAWIFQINTVLFGLAIILCTMICAKIAHSTLRSFLVYFILCSAISYGIGIFNMFPFSRLFPSTIAVMLFAICILVLATRMQSHHIKDINLELEQQQKFLRSIIDMNPNYIYAKDQHGKYTLANTAFAELMSLNVEDLIGKNDYEILNDDKKAYDIALVDKQLLNNSSPTKKLVVEEIMLQKDGAIKWLHTAKVPIHSNDQDIILGVSTDITERKHYEDKIRYQAYHDVLTALPNRRLFNEELEALLEKAYITNDVASVMFLDLDRFKYINDSLGHDIGDLLLIEVSKRLKESISIFKNNSIKMYRIGGDEFTLLLPKYCRELSSNIAQTIIDSFVKPFQVNDYILYITTSIGISCYPEDGIDAKALMKNADTAMYNIKDKGKNGYKHFSNEMNENIYRKMMIEKELRNAIFNSEFTLQYQPQLNIRTGQIEGIEALIRWDNPNLGKTSPPEFIPIAEETGLILTIGEWVLRSACSQNKKWQDDGYGPLKVAVNISMRQFIDPRFVGIVTKILEETGLDPKFLELEITESIAMADHHFVIQKLNHLKDLGILISIDDFGTGYSSLSYLKKYPLDCLKIDKSFIKDIIEHEENKAIVKTIISMAKHLNLKVVAEGVETNKDLRFLKESYCDSVQGYFISHPLDALQFEKGFLNSEIRTKTVNY